MKTVHEVSEISGISVRTLHYYDAIGLLKPTEVSHAGYRFYDDAALERLRSILLFRELQFPLKQIAVILDSPDFDHREALKQQIHLLELQRSRVDGLIALARNVLNEEEKTVSFSAFDHTEADRYAEEVKSRWGNTEAYRESRIRTEGKSSEELRQDGDGMMAVFARFGAIRGCDPACNDARRLVQELQQFITDHYYTCTREILSGLGQMYVSDDRFRANIDRAGGEGTAELVSRAIAAYCG